MAATKIDDMASDPGMDTLYNDLGDVAGRFYRERVAAGRHPACTASEVCAVAAKVLGDTLDVLTSINSEWGAEMKSLCLEYVSDTRPVPMSGEVN